MSEWLILRRFSDVSPHYVATIVEAESSKVAVERLAHLPEHVLTHPLLVVPLGEVREYVDGVRQLDVKVAIR